MVENKEEVGGYIYGLGRMEHAVKGGSYEVAPVYIPGVEKLLAG